MGAVLGWNRYGKARVRVMKVSRVSSHHHVRELTVDLGLEGDFDAAHIKGDNAAVLPTDTMKNTVYALAKEDPVETIESFGMRLARHFLAALRHVTRVRVEIVESQWKRIEVDGGEHPHVFARPGAEAPTCAVDARRDGATVRSGLRGLVLLKTADSGFSGFARDPFTTLKDVADRLMATSVTAEWLFAEPPEGFADARELVRSALVSAFAGHKSASVQHTLYAMGTSALAACAAIDEITISMPNKHCLLVDLSAFGMSNDNEIFAPTDEPYGLIEATVRRT